MSYTRVIPRDLFNEGNLLKCYGRLWILIDNFAPKDVEMEHTGQAFDIQQNVADGCLSIENIKLTIRGRRYDLFRPLNSREAWPLYLTDYRTCSEDESFEIPVFNDEGNFSDEMIALLQV